MDEKRLVDVETKLAYQEETLRVLEDLVAAQQKRVDQLEAICRRLAQRLSAAAESTGASTADDIVPFSKS